MKLIDIEQFVLSGQLYARLGQEFTAIDSFEAVSVDGKDVLYKFKITPGGWVSVATLRNDRYVFLDAISKKMCTRAKDTSYSINVTGIKSQKVKLA